jgi:hypothetical protein
VAYTNFGLRVIGEAENADKYSPLIQQAAGGVSKTHYFHVEPSEGDLVATIVFDVEDESVQRNPSADELMADELLMKLLLVLPNDLRMSIGLSDWPDDSARPPT